MLLASPVSTVLGPDRQCIGHGPTPAAPPACPPQVEKELEADGDIVFVREKTNYKSILYKTFYVSSGRAPGSREGPPGKPIQWPLGGGWPRQRAVLGIPARQMVLQAPALFLRSTIEQQHVEFWRQTQATGSTVMCSRPQPPVPTLITRPALACPPARPPRRCWSMLPPLTTPHSC